ncbi:MULTISPECIES: TetR/AcrR family transcriptional regulator [unclassified Streptosporangium]|uniref:TetR/AcrR family transcriptional regulator n=1 Tax=Streptosporangium sp. NPDC005286 TaxID=3154463 RepID=UPI0033A0C49B
MSRQDRKKIPEGEPLPRGRHGLPPEVVRTSQRDRLIQAMLLLVAARGYAATTVPDVIAAARVSRNAFYANFHDKEACFLALCERDLPGVVETILSAAEGTGHDWVAAVRQGLHAYLRWWQDRPEYARAYFVELPAAGRRAMDQRDRAYLPFLEMLRALAARARAETPSRGPVRESVPALIVFGVTEFIAAEVRAGNAERLSTLEEDVLHYTVTLLADRATADRALG